MQDRIHVYLIEPTDSPFFYAQWRLPGSNRRKTISLKTKDEAEAEQKRSELEYEVNRGIFAAPSRLTFEAFIEQYATDRLSDLAPASAPRVRSILGTFAAVSKPASLGAVNERMIREYVGHLRKLGRMASTIKSHLTRIHAAFAWAVRQKLLPAVPHFEEIKLPRHSHICFVSPEEYPVLLAAMPTPQWRFLVQVAWYTGMRRAELMTLRWDRVPEGIWIDWKANRVQISAEACKADKDQWVPIHPDLATILEANKQTSGKVFHLNRNLCGLSRAFSGHCRAAGLSFKLHDLRRSFGMRYAPLVPAQVLQRLMRHSNIQTTLRYYIDLEGSMEEAIKRA